MSRRTLAGGGALLLVASLHVLPATAHAVPTIDPLKPCYVTADLQVGQTGELVLARPFPAPFVESGSRSFTITLIEDANPANTASATAQSTALGVTVTPRQARPSQRIRFRGLGF